MGRMVSHHWAATRTIRPLPRRFAPQPKKFGADDRRRAGLFEDTGGARRTDTGHVLVQKQMPVFTQDAENHDVMITADEAGIFAEYLPYQTWDARPVAGSAGLVARTWHPALEAWGATQFQNRFEAMAGRPMREEDYQSLASGPRHRRGRNAGQLRRFRDCCATFILSPEFEIAGFKGQKLTLRDWDHQLRQPILLTTDALTVSVSPQDVYLHQVSQLDTLGRDRPETDCVNSMSESPCAFPS